MRLPFLRGHVIISVPHTSLTCFKNPWAKCCPNLVNKALTYMKFYHFSNSCDHIMAECQISITRFGHTVSTSYSNFMKITLTDRPLYRYMRLYRHKGISVKLISHKLTTQWLIFFQISWTDTLLTWRSIVYPSSFDLTKMIA